MSLLGKFWPSSKKSSKKVEPPVEAPAIIIDIEDHAKRVYETIREENPGKA